MLSRDFSQAFEDVRPGFLLPLRIEALGGWLRADAESKAEGCPHVPAGHRFVDRVESAKHGEECQLHASFRPWYIPQPGEDFSCALFRRMNTADFVIRIYEECYRHVPGERQYEISALIDRSYWSHWRGFLLGSVLYNHLKEIRPTSRLWIAAEDITNRMLHSKNYNAALIEHARLRYRLLQDGAQSSLDNAEVTLAETLSDYFLLQAAAMYDLRAAREGRAPGESTASFVARESRAFRLHFWTARMHLDGSENIYRILCEAGTDPKESSPDATASDVIEFAASRAGCSAG